MAAELQHERDRLGIGDRDPPERVAKRGSHAWRRIKHERPGETAEVVLGADCCGDPDRLVPQAGARIGDKLLEERHRHTPEPLEGPETTRAGGDSRAAVGSHFLQRGDERRCGAIDDLLPSQVGYSRIGSAEMLRQIVRRHLRHVNRLPDRLRRMPDPPDPAPYTVAIGMVSRHFVVRDDLVVPIDHVEAAVGTKLDRNRTKRGIGAGQQIGSLAIRISFTRPAGDDRLDLIGDRIGDVEHPLTWRGTDARAPRTGPAIEVVRERETAQAAAAHLRRPEWRGHQRLVGPEPVGRDGRHEHAGLVRKDRKAKIVGLLEPPFALPRDRQTPDIVGTGCDRLEEGAIGSQPTELAGVESHLRCAIGEW